MARNILIGVVLFIVALIVLTNSAYAVDMTRQAVLLQFGEHIATVTSPGIHFKVPFVQQVALYEKRVLTSDVKPGEYLTLDKKRLTADPVSRWRIVDPLLFYKTVTTEIGALARLEPIILSELRDELANHNFTDIISSKRQPIMDVVSKQVREKATEFGIEVIDVRIKRADLPKEVQNSVFERMQAERQRIALQYRAEGDEQAAKIMADADKQVTIIKAEAYEESQKLMGAGDAGATSIYADAFERDAEFYGFLRTLESYQKFMLGNSTVVLDAGSDLFKYLTGPEPPEARK